MIRAYIGLGSNLNQPRRQVGQALTELAALPQTKCVGHSKFYRSAPLGPQDQPDYINAVAALDTVLEPYDLLARLQTIEQSHHRVRKRHWGERTLDLDLLLYGDLEIATERLTIPHASLHERAFVLYPLAEIAPHTVVPGRGRVVALAHCCSPGGLQCLENDGI
ncbi:2-amino-4-hydroxy-6-hydroxymethyldihydropteridine diphosphokinase [Nitrosococcus watsonii]|uniref:2-amino-4-hydroxy-6-hydroxymethyldihydropteridine pyrophosphokinase n=1 Tax=Nitrosococcus watsoni (strain C-113) TaxID=105559 RepID=D8KBU4_NITWC|nr:2-amino-4-hydroxy-6-hydroxymethyldihydropteridine diphosphokinase [Nitrosococcus watsonii]ADJ27705.1 2-amino-4-hydroxy-6-hydroxymethyldihydropteridine pyrophosphokinase [Nitrosococcus watsonii C-113]